MNLRTNKKDSQEFIDSAYANNKTYLDNFYRMQKICLSMFHWENLPESMNERYLEKCLFENGQCALLYDKKYGFINTRCADGDGLNLYELPTTINCYSVDYRTRRQLNLGVRRVFNSKDGLIEGEEPKDTQAILVMNNFDRTPTISTIDLFAYRMYLAQRSADVNVSATRTPVILLGNDKQQLSIKNIWNKMDGNQPAIVVDKDNFGLDQIRTIDTKVEFLAKDLMEYKKEIWNEFLEFIGVNTINVEKKERLITGESNANNEVINFNLQSYLIPRQEACKRFNELFGLTGTDKEIRVTLRSDLYNTIKEQESIINDYNVEIEKSDING